MARGWESKAVDEQMAAAEAARTDVAPTVLTAADRDRARRRDTLRLNRSRTLQLLQTACDRRHRALLEQTLAELDAQLTTLED